MKAAQGGDVVVLTQVFHAGHIDLSVVHRAAAARAGERPDAAPQLLQAGASVGEIDTDGSGAVHRAAREGHVQALQVVRCTVCTYVCTVQRAL